MSSDRNRQLPGPKPWWNDGLRFSCQGSGKCCVSYGANHYVYVTLEDRRRLAAATKLPTRQFTRKYCTKRDGLFHLVGYEGPCVFLDGRRCSVYEARPTQCRTWPFWPENMRAEKWDRVATFCPGVGEGQVIPADEIREILQKQRRSTDEL
ncbi:MAG: YkgJ family cysteine cluster protein [Gammaproteobacteria bacterium]